MKQIILKVPTKIMLVIFFSFFLYEYISPMIQVLRIVNYNDINMEEIIQQPKVLKHFIRMPIYLVLYIVLFYKVLIKNSKIAYVTQQIILISHLIFKPLMVVGALLYIKSAGLPEELAHAGVAIMLIWAGVIFIVYLFTILYLHYYRQSYTDQTSNTSLKS